MFFNTSGILTTVYFKTNPRIAKDWILKNISVKLHRSDSYFVISWLSSFAVEKF